MTRRTGLLERATALVADFGNPFYAEERQRDVWNEASAVGFQTLLWAGVALAAAMTWIGASTLAGGLVGAGVAALALIFVRRARD